MISLQGLILLSLAVCNKAIVRCNLTGGGLLMTQNSLLAT